jgi:hypothetical protein
MLNKGNQPYLVTILSIPNIWLNFYVYGFLKHPNVKLKLKPIKKYSEYNFTMRMAVSIEYKNEKRTIIIDTDDPSADHFNYIGFDFVFISQKLLKSKSIYPDNVIALNPHFPFRHNIINYLLLKKLIFLNYPVCCMRYFIQNLRLKKMNDILNIRNSEVENLIFYYRSLWAKEYQTNLLGAVFLDFFTRQGYNVIGGLYRIDGFKTNNTTIDKFIVKSRLDNKKYLQYLSKSKYVLNTPAVRGAISWRFAEYLFVNKNIVSTEFKVELPTKFNYYLVNEDEKTFTEELDKLQYFKGCFDNRTLVAQVLLPTKQIDYIFSFLKLN